MPEALSDPFTPCPDSMVSGSERLETSLSLSEAQAQAHKGLLGPGAKRGQSRNSLSPVFSPDPGLGLAILREIRARAALARTGSFTIPYGAR